MVGPQVFGLGNHMAITNFRTWRPDLWILILRHRKIHYENTLRLSSPSKFPQDLPANHFILENFNIFQTNSSKPHPTISRKKPTKQQKKHVTTYYPAAAGSPMCPHFWFLASGPENHFSVARMAWIRVTIRQPVTFPCRPSWSSVDLYFELPWNWQCDSCRSTA